MQEEDLKKQWLKRYTIAATKKGQQNIRRDKRAQVEMLVKAAELNKWVEHFQEVLNRTSSAEKHN